MIYKQSISWLSKSFPKVILEITENNKFIIYDNRTFTHDPIIFFVSILQSYHTTL